MNKQVLILHPSPGVGAPEAVVQTLIAAVRASGVDVRELMVLENADGVLDALERGAVAMVLKG